MNVKLKMFVFLSFFCSHLWLNAQKFGSKKLVFYSNNAMFPDGIKPSNDNRYNDNSTIILIPKSFKKNQAFQLFFWFHGWGNNINQTLESFKLEEELIASGINAILVLPEAAKNANDSYAGKWEKANVFSTYLNELKDFLNNKSLIEAEQPHSLIFAGHSGAANVLTRLMQHNTHHVKGVLLFDAINYEVDKIANFLQQSTTTKFITLFSPKSSFAANSLKLAQVLEKRKIGYLQKQDTQFLAGDLHQSRIILLPSQLHHNDVATTNHYISKFLKAIDSF